MTEKRILKEEDRAMADCGGTLLHRICPAMAEMESLLKEMEAMRIDLRLEGGDAKPMGVQGGLRLPDEALFPLYTRVLAAD